MLRLLLVSIFFISPAVPAQGQDVLPRKTALVRPLQPVLEVLRRAGVSGSLELSAHCENRGIVLGAVPLLPRLHVSEVSNSSPLEALRGMFADDPAMHVTQNGDDTIRMIEGGVPSNLLSTRIKHIHLESMRLPSQNATFVASNAMLHVILDAPELVASMEANHIVFPFNGQGGSFGIESVPESAPRFSVDMDNLTLAEALDKVLEKFPGLWIYETCTRAGEKNSVVGIWYFDLQSPGPYAEELR
jgi:hypothetical protein